jgi:hypothetical protein
MDSWKWVVRFVIKLELEGLSYRIGEEEADVDTLAEEASLFWGEDISRAICPQPLLVIFPISSLGIGRDVKAIPCEVPLQPNSSFVPSPRAFSLLPFTLGEYLALRKALRPLAIWFWAFSQPTQPSFLFIFPLENVVKFLIRIGKTSPKYHKN